MVSDDVEYMFSPPRVSRSVYSRIPIWERSPFARANGMKRGQRCSRLAHSTVVTGSTPIACTHGPSPSSVLQPVQLPHEGIRTRPGLHVAVPARDRDPDVVDAGQRTCSGLDDDVERRLELPRLVDLAGDLQERSADVWSKIHGRISDSVVKDHRRTTRSRGD